MIHREMLLFKEKCLDCQHFVRAHPFARYFLCRFGLLPVQLKGKEKGELISACNIFIDFPNKEAKAWKVVEKLRRKK